MKLLLCAVALLLSLSSASASSLPHDPLRTWLSQLTLELGAPGASSNSSRQLLHSNGSVAASTWLLNCSSLELGRISVVPRPSQLELTLEMAGMGLVCQSSWAQPGGGSPAVVQVAFNASRLALGLQLLRASPVGLPAAARVLHFADDFRVSELEAHHVPLWLQALLLLRRAEVEQALVDCLQLVLEAGAGIAVDLGLTAGIQALDAAILPYLKPRPPLPPRPPPADSTNLLQDKTMEALQFLVTQVLGNNQSELNVNNLLRAGTGNQEDAILSVNSWLNASLLALVQADFDLATVRLKNLDTVKLLDLYLTSPTLFQARLNVAGLMMEADVNYTVAPLQQDLLGPVLSDDGFLRFMLADLDVELDMQLELDQNCLADLAPENMDSPGCIAWCIDSLMLYNMDLKLNTNNTDLQLAVGTADFDAAVDSLLRLLTEQYQPIAAVAVQNLANGPFRDNVNMNIAQFLSEQPACHRSPAESWTVSEVAGGAAGAGLVLLLIVTVTLRRPTKALLATDDGDVDIVDFSPSINAGQAKSSESSAANRSAADSSKQSSDKQPLINGSVVPTASLAQRVHWFWAITMPVLLIGTFWLLIVSYTLVSAQVIPSFSYNGTTNNYGIVKDLKYTTTVKELWQAKVYVLDIFIFFFSGLWPCVKMTLLLFIWVAPTCWLSRQRRLSWLKFLDASGKWGLLDIYVSIMLIVGMRLHLPVSDGDDNHPSAVDLWVRPRPALFMYWAVIMASFAETHLMLALLRRIEDQDLEDECILLRTEVLLPAQPLAKRTFRDSQGTLWALTSRGRLAVALSVVLAAAGIVYGASITAFTFNFEGFVAWVLQDEGYSSQRSFSLLSMGVDLPRSGLNGASAPLRVAQVLFFLLTLGATLASQALLLLLWLIPLRHARQTLLYHVTEIVRAWSAVEVFLVSILVAVWQLQPLARFIVKDSCSPINNFLKSDFDRPLQGHDTCFEVTTAFNSGIWILAVACFFNIVLTNRILWLASKALDLPSVISRTRSSDTMEFSRCQRCSMALWHCLSRLAVSLGLVEVLLEI